jgi:hypothetical protein
MEEVHPPMPSTRPNVSIGGVMDSGNIDINTLRLRRNMQRARERERERFIQGVASRREAAGLTTRTSDDARSHMPRSARNAPQQGALAPRYAELAGDFSGRAPDMTAIRAGSGGVEGYRAALAAAAAGGGGGGSRASSTVDTRAMLREVILAMPADEEVDETRFPAASSLPAMVMTVGSDGQRVAAPHADATAQVFERARNGAEASERNSGASTANSNVATEAQSTSPSAALSFPWRAYSSRPPIPQAITEYQRRYNRNWDPESSFSATGLLLSGDGRRMWVGTKKGLFEFRFNLRGRMMFQNCEMA